MTLEELAIGFNSTLEALLNYLELPSNIPGDTKLKDIEDVVETATIGAIKRKMTEYVP